MKNFNKLLIGEIFINIFLTIYAFGFLLFENKVYNLSSLVFGIFLIIIAIVKFIKFLKKENERSGCKDNNGAVSVIAYSQDEKQLLLGFGCGNTLARMFAVKKDDGWKAISPTNQFNLFEVPSCKMTDENNISKEIAPVCQNESRAAENAPLTYSYRVR